MGFCYKKSENKTKKTQICHEAYFTFSFIQIYNYLCFFSQNIYRNENILYNHGCVFVKVLFWYWGV